MLTARPPVMTPMLAVVSGSIRPSRIAAIASAATWMALTPRSGAIPACAARPRTTASMRLAPGARVKAKPTASLSNTSPLRARSRVKSRCLAPRSPTSSQTVNTTSSGGWRKEPSRQARTHSQTIATPDLSSPPSTVVPSLRITSSSTTGLTPTPGSTVSMCAQRRSAGASTVPGTCAIRFPVSPPISAPAPSKLTSAPSSASSRASRAAMRPSRRERLSIWTSSRKSACKRAGWITGAGPYWKAIRGSNMTLFAPRAGRIVRGMRVIFGAELPEPGRATVTVCADPVLIGALEPAADGQRARAVAWACALADAGIPAAQTEAIVAELWAKVFYNAALNPLGALLDLPYGALAEDAEARAVMDLVIAEAFAVARAAGIVLRWPDAGAYRAEFYGRLVPATARHRSSMLQDLARGRPTEIEAINGYVAARGAALGMPAPTHLTLTRLIRARARSRSWKS